MNYNGDKMGIMNCTMSMECILCIDNRALYEEIKDLFYYNYFKGWQIDYQCKSLGYLTLWKDSTEWY